MTEREMEKLLSTYGGADVTVRRDGAILRAYYGERFIPFRAGSLLRDRLQLVGRRIRLDLADTK
jgi:hypothetical protein